MGDYAIRMQFDVDADPAAVRQALTTTEGIAGWWSDGVEGTPGETGGHLQVRFPDLPQPFEFAVTADGSQLRWTTGAYPPWWQGTAIGWRVESHPDKAGTLLRFTHAGFDPDDAIIPIITPAWADIIQRLKRLAETGRADPFAVNAR